MSDEIKIDNYYKIHAKDFINFLFNKNFLNPNLIRESIDGLEEYCGFLMQSFCQVAAKSAVLSAKAKRLKLKEEKPKRDNLKSNNDYEIVRCSDVIQPTAFGEYPTYIYIRKTKADQDINIKYNIHESY